LYSVLTSDLEEMNLETYYDYCLLKRSDGTFSFDEDALVFKGGKIYALSSLMHWKKGAGC
jgi:hypothetical protein